MSWIVERPNSGFETHFLVYGGIYAERRWHLDTVPF
jgi:hypothetical protein